MPSASPNYSLTDEQKQQFLDHGFIKLDSTDNHPDQCFSLDDPLCRQLMRDMWERLDMDPNDKSSWTPDRVHLPRRTEHAIPMSEFSPKAWSAICELSGGADRVLTEPKVMPPPLDEPVPQGVMNDSFICAFGNAELKQKWKEAAGENGIVTPATLDDLTEAQKQLLDPHDRNNWHVDGDFFHHFLDSPEQGLLPIVLFSDVKVGGGGTMICPDAIPVLAKHLYGHPEGVRPDMSTLDRDADEAAKAKANGDGYFANVVKTMPKESFLSATGTAGDVYLLHPLMLHSGAPNYLNEPRIITNPPVGLCKPFNFDRQDGSEYSTVEKKTLLAIGKPEGLPGWRITSTERTLLVPQRIKDQIKAKKEGLAGTAQPKKHWAPNVL